jgi:L-ascorbate metabolism protein UlaG (beta-lactamase superfamily)
VIKGEDRAFRACEKGGSEDARDPFVFGVQKVELLHDHDDVMGDELTKKLVHPACLLAAPEPFVRVRACDQNDSL